MTTKSQKQRATNSANAYNLTYDIGQILRGARKATDMRYEYIAQCMGVSPDEWLQYEQNKKLIPGHIMLKLVMFGMDFWCKNQKTSELCTLNTAH